MVEGLCAFGIAVVVGTLVEYWVHRWMHSWLLKKKHALHHRDGWGQGWLGEFGDYFLPCIPVIWLGLLVSVPAGVGWALGAFVYASLAAYAHRDTPFERVARILRLLSCILCEIDPGRLVCHNAPGQARWPVAGRDA